MQVYDTRRAPLTLGRELHRGGEGLIYQVEGRADLLAKVYVPVRPAAETKLAWMQRNPPSAPKPGAHPTIAWPRDLLYDAQGAFLGYLMPHVRQAVPLFDVFNPRRRAQTLPGFNGVYLHRTARNLAAALAALHAHDYVVGDLNESNVLVTPTALVTLIDTDSFQVKVFRDGAITFFPCPVGKPEYTPPELQGKTFNREVRQSDHDRFGLGVLIFQLLMGGSHPFRSSWQGHGDPPPVAEKIARGWFPYATCPLGPVAPPTQGASLEAIHPGVAQLVRRCFEDGHADSRRRPTPVEWEDALAEAEKSLATCRNGHIYSGHLRACPHCGSAAARATIAQRAVRATAQAVKKPVTATASTASNPRRARYVAAAPVAL
jgi:DNA-binding helix-hairpin-helix protein with protein kinase domain